MSTSSSASSTSMSWRRAKSPGWAAFDLKQQQKDGFELEVDKEPYPSMSSTIKPLHPCQNFVQKNNLPVRSFSSVLVSADKFPNLTDDEDHKITLPTGNSGVTQSNKFTCEIDIVQAYTKLKKLHCWAGESLIEDIMAAVDNDFNQASALLTAMASSESFEENKDRCMGESKDIDAEHSPSNHKTLLADKSDSFGESANLAELICALEDCLNCKNEKLTDNHASSGNKNSDDAAAHMKVILGHLRSIPIEPEWKEDDIYLLHRKDAIKMMRLASKHSKAATDAYLRGDHFSAQQFSVKAREEWMTAEKLNAKAVKEILSMKNSKNGLWKLDLHGLHAVEAVQALQEHLQKLESLELGRSLSPTKKSKTAGILHSGSLKSSSHVEKEKFEQCSSSRQRPTLLHVITGKGTHSKGQAALPNAIRSFLNEKGYHYDEARPGLITVRPKFRRH